MTWKLWGKENLESSKTIKKKKAYYNLFIYFLFLNCKRKCKERSPHQPEKLSRILDMYEFLQIFFQIYMLCTQMKLVELDELDLESESWTALLEG
jgi:hypothetical protein